MSRDTRVFLGMKSLMLLPSSLRAAVSLATCLGGPPTPQGFDWWHHDSRHIEWAGVVCRAAFGSSALPALNSGPDQGTRDNLGLSPLEQVKPFLATTDTGKDTRALTPATDNLAVQVVSYNVLSLNGAAFSDAPGEGLAFAAGRPAMLAKLLEAHNIGVAFLQEARTQEGVLRTQSFVRFCSGSDKGHLGVEIWVRDPLPLIRRGPEVLTRLCREACSVVHSDSRRLYFALPAWEFPSLFDQPACTASGSLRGSHQDLVARDHALMRTVCVQRSLSDWG